METGGYKNIGVAPFRNAHYDFMKCDTCDTIGAWNSEAWTSEASTACPPATDIDDQIVRAAILAELAGDAFQGFFEKCTLGVTVANPALDNSLLSASIGLSEMTGYTPFELTGACLRFLEAPLEHQDQSSLTALRIAMAPGGPPTTVVLVQQQKGGKLFRHMIDTQWLRVATHVQESSLLIGIHVDVTDIDSEAELEKLCARFRQVSMAVRTAATQELATLAVCIAHDQGRFHGEEYEDDDTLDCDTDAYSFSSTTTQPPAQSAEPRWC